MKLILAGVGLMLFSHAASAASFDCAVASTRIEKAICADAALSELDEYLGRYFAGASETLKDGAACLKSEQRQWLKTVRNNCKLDAACLKDVYLNRLAALDGLQPGASQLKNIELPKTPILVTAIPPSADFGDAKAGKTKRVAGKLVHEGTDINNMGYAVKPENGPDGSKAEAFVFDMDIGASPTHEAVRAIIDQNDNAIYEVRGQATADGQFNTGQCRYIYRFVE